MSCAIRLSDVCYTYKNNTQQKYAVDSLSAQIEEGSFVCILGANGSGKSTLAKLLNSLLTPTSGTIERNSQIIPLVFQNPDNQIISSIVKEDTSFGPENLGVNSEEIVSIVNQSLNKVSMSDFSDRETGTLSAGQKQRICIAGALAMQGKCIVLDEPCSMLDPKGCKEVLEVLKNLHKSGCTIILITHNLDLAQYADRVLIMSEGKFVKDGKAESIFQDEEELKQYNLLLTPAIKFKNYLRKAKIHEV